MDETISIERENAAVDQVIAMAVEEIADAEK